MVQADGCLRSGQRRYEHPGYRFLTSDGSSVGKIGILSNRQRHLIPGNAGGIEHRTFHARSLIVPMSRRVPNLRHTGEADPDATGHWRFQ